MFGLFKRSIERSIVIKDFADDLERIMKTIDDLAQNDGIATSSVYPKEAKAFTYILGWISIQTSKLGVADRQRFSADLTGEWAERMSNSKKSVEDIAFLQSRISAYRDAMKNGKGRDWFASIVFRFMQHLSIDSPEHVALQGALYSSMPAMIDALTGFLNGIGKKFKFV